MGSKSQEKAIELINVWLDHFRKTENIPSITISLVNGGNNIYSNSYGYSNLMNKTESNTKSMYRVASVSKMFTANMIFKLLEEDKLSLEDKLNKYFEEINSNISNITIRQLLSHQSGIKSDGNTLCWEDDNFPDKEFVLEELKKDIKIYAPMEQFKYSNLGYAILGLIIEKITIKSFVEFSKDFLSVLEMKNTYSDLEDSSITGICTPYKRKSLHSDEPLNNVQTKAFSASTGFISSVEDLSKFVRENLNPVKLSKNSLEEMRKVRTSRDSDLQYGYGYETWHNSNILVNGHGGSFNGYSSQILIDNENDIGIVVLTNSMDSWTNTIANSIHAIWLYVKNNFKDDENNDELSKLKGKYSNKRTDEYVTQFNNGLICIYLNSETPMNGFSYYKHKTDQTFLIGKEEDYSWAGEELKFIFENNSTVKIIEGSTEIFPN